MSPSPSSDEQEPVQDRVKVEYWGVVLDNNGEPLPEVTLFVQLDRSFFSIGPDLEFESTVQSDSNGEFQIEVPGYLGLGLEVFASKSGYRSSKLIMAERSCCGPTLLSPQREIMSSASDFPGLEMGAEVLNFGRSLNQDFDPSTALQPLGNAKDPVLRGEIVNQDNEPQKNLRIQLMAKDKSGEEVLLDLTSSSKDGAFRFPNIPLDQDLVLKLNEADLSAADVSISAEQLLEPVKIVVEASSLPEIKDEIEMGSSFAGYIFGADHKPVDNAKVTVNSLNEKIHFLASTTSNSDGLYYFHSAPEGTQLVLTVEKMDYQTQKHTIVLRNSKEMRPTIEISDTSNAEKFNFGNSLTEKFNAEFDFPAFIKE